MSSQREVSITGNNNTRVKVTGQEELLVKVNSIQLGTGDPATSTTVGADTGLDVNIIGGVALSVNLDALDDQVGIYGYTDINDPTSVKAIKVDTTGAVAIDASDLDIRDLVFATDKVDVSGSSVSVSNFPATQPVSGPLTDAELRATAVPVSGTFFQATQPVSAASLPLPTGAATEATLLDVKTSVQLLDDCVGTDGTAAPTKSLVIAGVTAGGVTQQTIEVSGSGHVHISDGGGSITVDGGIGVSRTPTFLRPTGVSGTVALGTYSMSFASVGTANATVGGITLKPGETLSFDAGAINNTLGAVTYSTLTSGAELIIITLT